MQFLPAGLSPIVYNSTFPLVEYPNIFERDSIMQEAEKRLPHAWYEFSSLNLAVAAPVSVFSYAVLFHLFGEYKDWVQHIVSAVTYTLSEVIKIASSTKALRETQRTRALGIETSYGETNRILADISDHGEFLKSRRLQALSLLGLGIAIAEPGAGLPLSAIKL